MTQLRDPKAGYTFLFVFLSSLFALHYLVPREATLTLGMIYFILFGSYAWISFLDQPDWRKILTFGLFARLLLLFGLPSLSDDFYRFLWDGSLINAGISPYQFTPEELSNQSIVPYQDLLYSALNSPRYYSVYTPIHQAQFVLSTYFSQDLLAQVNWMRAFFLVGDLGAFFLAKKLLPSENKFALSLLFLNPLIILEGVGNLHVEVLVIPFLLLLLYCFKVERVKQSAIALGVAIALKLTPALLIPALAWNYRWKKGIFWFLLLLLISSLLLLPMFWHGYFENIAVSLRLYQRTFEFNASIYYLLREIGFWHKGYNVIATLGPWLTKTAGLSILLLTFWSSWKRRPLAETLLFCWTVYLMLSTTVHPWYILPLIPLGLASGYYYPIVWTFSIFFSYFGYTFGGYEPTFGWIFFEYLILYAFLTYEIVKRNSQNSPRDTMGFSI